MARVGQRPGRKAALSYDRPSSGASYAKVPLIVRVLCAYRCW